MGRCSISLSLLHTLTDVDWSPHNGQQCGSSEPLIQFLASSLVRRRSCPVIKGLLSRRISITLSPASNVGLLSFGYSCSSYKSELSNLIREG